MILKKFFDPLQLRGAYPYYSANLVKKMVPKYTLPMENRLHLVLVIFEIVNQYLSLLVQAMVI